MEAATVDLEVQYKDSRLTLARSLVVSLESGDDVSAESAIGELTKSYESYIFQEVGKLTRELHDTLGFCRDEQRLAQITQNEIPDARERLNYVIQKTEESAHRTLDIVENLLPISTELENESDSMQKEWQRFKRREMDVEEFRKLSTRLESFLDSACSSAVRIKQDLNEVMLGQDYQDLTGQIIRKVIDMVQEVEDKLVGVMRHASKEVTVVKSVKNIEVEGPQIHNDKPNVMSGQDDVDDLLSSLGF
ncbi:MAG: protein phosphatase CheZ [Gammaproteobacteria bacterium]